MLLRPLCKICAQACATIEVIPSVELPAEWHSWERVRQDIFQQYRQPASTYLLYSGPGGSNGWVGDVIGADRAAAIAAAFAGVPTAEKIQAAGFSDGAGFCAACEAFYCPTHWSISETGYGVCPKGHGQSLDPHWHPD